jgi:hypothetical protein
MHVLSGLWYVNPLSEGCAIFYSCFWGLISYCKQKAELVQSIKIYWSLFLINVGTHTHPSVLINLTSLSIALKRHMQTHQTCRLYSVKNII